MGFQLSSSDLFGSVDLPITRCTRLKIATVKLLARWCHIPISVHEDALPEVIRAQIDRYIAECSYLLEHVYDGDYAQQWKFEDFAYDHLLGNVKNPFLLHQHPLYFVGQWLGIYDWEIKDDGKISPTTDPRYAEAERRHRELCQNDEFYRANFSHGWRVAFGKDNKTKSAACT